MGQRKTAFLWATAGALLATVVFSGIGAAAIKDAYALGRVDERESLTVGATRQDLVEACMRLWFAPAVVRGKPTIPPHKGATE